MHFILTVKVEYTCIGLRCYVKSNACKSLNITRFRFPKENMNIQSTVCKIWTLRFDVARIFIPLRDVSVIHWNEGDKTNTNLVSLYKFQCVPIWITCKYSWPTRTAECVWYTCRKISNRVKDACFHLWPVKFPSDSWMEEESILLSVFLFFQQQETT